MAYYLVTADPKKELLPELKKLLDEKSFSKFKPFGNTLTYSLSNAKIMKNGRQFGKKRITALHH